jgi:hypothetical protein
MTTLITFKPSSTSVFQFTAYLDGNLYTITCPYNIYGQRYYINIFNNFGALILSRPMIGSPNGYDINLLLGYFKNSSLVYRVSSNTIEISP